MSELDPFLTLAQVAERWACSGQNVRNQMAKGLIGHRLGAWRFKLSDVIAFEEERATAKPAPRRQRKRPLVLQCLK